ncbi:hypothetical protein PpBr36_04992 [Pyricularia pennisetigena]|uniref:hypothetical protein n=1 Tax=Pyricularia pennisetigena TaxID=1578925 RepID=UPI0011516836|nr:hypothetical protein PpBr36_04992 [Pyricularia pennisetigena]TLS27533.1 hypothetical protein PpBr36_04992 [Pyricularia pennisetigena]
MEQNAQNPIRLLSVTNTVAEVVVPTAVPTVTDIWLPERIPDSRYPDEVRARVDWPYDGTTRWSLRSLPINTFYIGHNRTDFDDFNWWASLGLKYSGEGATVLNMAYSHYIGGAYATKDKTMTWTGTTMSYFFTGECTSTPEASLARCTGSYGITGIVYTSVSPGGTTVTVSPISSVTQFPTAPSVTPARVTVTAAPTDYIPPSRDAGAPSTTSSSSGRGAPHPTQHVAAILGAAVVLGGAAAMVV